jgi:hypothetical protein
MDLNTPQNPLSQIPSNAPLTKKNMHYEYFILAIAIIIVAVGICWWQIGELNRESTFDAGIISPTITTRNDEISDINKDLEATEVNTLDTEFQQIDSELNSL